MTTSRLTEVQVTHDFLLGAPVWDGAIVYSVPEGTGVISVPALGSTQYAVRTRVQDVYGNYSAWSTYSTHTTTDGADSLVVPDGSITTPKLAAGAITLYDENGTAVITPAGMDGGLAEFLATGAYNGVIGWGTTSSNVPNGRTSTLPYWTVSRTTGTPTITRDANTSFPGGSGLGMNTVSAVGVVKLLSDKVRVIGGTPYALVPFVQMHSDIGIQVSITYKINWYRRDGMSISTVTGSKTLIDGAAFGPAWIDASPSIAPANASYAEIEILLERAAHSAATHVFFGGVRFLPTPVELYPLGTYSIATLSASGEVAAASLNAPQITAISTYAGNVFTAYTPTIGNAGTATFTSRTGYYQKIGKMVMYAVEFQINAVGSGGGTITVSLPSAPGQVSQVNTAFVTGAAAGFQNGAGVALLNTGAGAVITQVRDSLNIALTRALFGAGMTCRVSGWYMEA